MRRFTMISASVGALLCVLTAATGMYWGMYDHTDFWRNIHLKLAISCVFVSLVAHVLSIHMMRKHEA